MGDPPPGRAVPGGGGGMPAGRAPSPSDGRRRQPGGTPVGGRVGAGERTDGRTDGQDRQTDRGSLSAASRHPDVRELGWGAVGQAGRAQRPRGQREGVFLSEMDFPPGYRRSGCRKAAENEPGVMGDVRELKVKRRARRL